MTMHIKIGDVTTLSVTKWKVKFDDRQEKFEIISGVVVQDFGHIEEGYSITCQVSIWQKDAETLSDYWHKRTLVDVVDEAGFVWNSQRVLIKSYSFRPFFPNVLDVELEFWGV